MRALTFHQCGPGSNPGADAICGLSLLLVLSFAARGFSPGTPVFPSPLLREVFLRVLRFSPLLCSERFFSGYSGSPLSFAPRGFSPGTPVFPSPQKSTLQNSNSIWNARTHLKEFIRTHKCPVYKQITIYNFTNDV